MRVELGDFAGMRVTVMGLGLHGGGLASARFLMRHGAEVTVTDMKSERELEPALASLNGLPVRLVLGRHDLSDFETADLVIKNPAVPRDSEYLRASRNVETDVSLFCRLTDSPIIAVTGTKGKSTTASAIHHLLKSVDSEAKLGGNITTSPLAFVEQCLDSSPPVVLELSSWQLADLAESGVMSPTVAVVTNIMKDHQNRYSDMDEYVDDKRVIFRHQRTDQFTVLNQDDERVRSFAAQTPAQTRVFSTGPLEPETSGGWLEEEQAFRREGTEVDVLFEGPVRLVGAHNRVNLLAASVAAGLFGLRPEIMRREIPFFPGIEHRLELVATKKGVRYYNDSAATIPDATLAAVSSFRDPIHLIAGGTDKALDYTPFAPVGELVTSAHLLDGSATQRIVDALRHHCRRVRGPYQSLTEALEDAAATARDGDVVLLSPGCASFEMFANEFDRGRVFRSLVSALPD